MKGHNPCPVCGGGVYGVVDVDSMYHIECKVCEMKYEKRVPFFEDLPNHEILNVQLNWNDYFLRSKLTERALEVTGIRNGDYLITDSVYTNILFVASTEKEVEENFLRTPPR